MTHPAPTTFPGCIYDPQGKRLDAAGPDMMQEQLDEHLHQTLFVMQESAPVSRVWLLADDADAAAVPAVVMADAVRIVVAKQGILIAARRPEAEVDVREGLVRALDLFEATAGTDEWIEAWPDSGRKHEPMTFNAWIAAIEHLVIFEVDTELWRKYFDAGLKPQEAIDQHRVDEEA